MRAADLRKLHVRVLALESGYDAGDLRRALALYRDEGTLPGNPALRLAVEALAADLAAAWATMQSDPSPWSRRCADG